MLTAFLSTSLFCLRDGLLVGLLAGLAFLVGRRLLGRLELPDPAERWGLALAIGLGALGQVAFVLALADLLRPLPLALAAVAALLGAGPARGELRRDLARAAAGLRARAFASLGCVALALLLTSGALYPPTAWDETTYHLPLAKAFVQAGGYVFVAPLRTPVFPLLQETLFAALWPAGAWLTAHRVESLSTVATALLVLAWGRRRLAAPWGSLAAAIFLGSPIVVYYAGTAYVDPGLALFATMALYGADRWLASGDRRWLLVAGAGAGWAAATKYLGLYFFAALPLAVLWGRAHPRRWAAVGWGLLVALAVATPWYARIVWWTGNPLFPFLPSVFGASAWSGPLAGGSGLDLAAFARELATRLPARTLALLRLPWDGLVARQLLNRQPPLSPFFLLGLPALLAVWRSRPWSRPLVLLATGYLATFTLLPADARYLLPILSVVALLVAAALAQAGAALVRRFPALPHGLAPALVLVALLPGPFYATFHLARQGPLPADAEARERYLARRLPLYPAIAHLNRARGSTYSLYTLYAEQMIYHVGGRALGEWLGPAPYAAIVPLLDEPAALAARLRALDADCLLVPKRRDLPPLAPAAELAPYFERVYEDPAATVLARRAPG